MASVLQGKTKNVIALLKHNPDVTLGEKDGCESLSPVLSTLHSAPAVA
jgi:hypothetical protein